MVYSGLLLLVFLAIVCLKRLLGDLTVACLCKSNGCFPDKRVDDESVCITGWLQREGEGGGRERER